MKIFDKQPNYEDFFKNEVATLTYIGNWGLLSYFKDLDTIIHSNVSLYQSKIKKSNLEKFDFHASFYMEVERSLKNVIIGANVVADFKKCSYFLVIVEEEDNKKIIRKFHFDFAIPANSPKQRVPSYHLQYGGKMSPKMVEAGLDDTKIDHWLSVPRLNFYPMNLALLFDVMLCEFKTQETDNIIQSSEWRSLVFDNEIFLSANYYKAIFEHLQSQQYKQSKLIRDFCYGD